jgi:protease I
MSDTKPLQGKKVAVLVESEYIADEVEIYRSRFPELGAEVHFMANLWGEAQKKFVCDIDSPDTPVSQIHTMVVDRDVATVQADEYDIVIQTANYTSCRLREIPPMGSLGSPEETPTAPAVQFFADAMSNRRIVKGAMCHALWILTPCPELLAGRRVICHTVVLADIHNAGAIFVADPREVVVDGDLVTARSFANMEAYFNAIVQLALATDPVTN